MANKEIFRRNELIKKLNEYVTQMAYKPIKPPVASERTVGLAEMRKRNIVGLYVDHKNDMEPKERSERIGRLIEKYKTPTTEELEDIIKQNRKKQAKFELQKKRKQVIYHETLFKLKQQCEQQLMNAIVTKFVYTVARRAIFQPIVFEAENDQRLQKSLVCNMFLALQIPKEQQSQDYSIYNKLASVLTNLIRQALFLAQSTYELASEKEYATDKLPDNTEEDRCIKLRALRAAKKKLNHHWQQKSSRFGGCLF